MDGALHTHWIAYYWQAGHIVNLGRLDGIDQAGKAESIISNRCGIFDRGLYTWHIVAKPNR